MIPFNFRMQLNQAHALVARGEVLRAEMAYLAILQEWPSNCDALVAIAELALLRDDVERATSHFELAVQHHPQDDALLLRWAEVCNSLGQPTQAKLLVEKILSRSPANFVAWLMLGWLRHAAGDGIGSLRAWYQAMTCAQKAGHWLDEATTPQHLVDNVLAVAAHLRIGTREMLFESYETIRQQIGSSKLARVDRALTGYLGEWDASPPDARQRPKFFYFPDLPPGPYHDPYLQPWAEKLQRSFSDIRGEAIRVWTEDSHFKDFLEFPPGANVADYLQGDGPRPSWEALFFYRHGRRYDDTHARCPMTSAALDSIELCRVADEAPEICFSVLSPGSHIMPHYGVTNTRLVLHLPLVVPSDCALRVVDGDQHAWQEGRLMMFDDTYQHEAWNRSDSTRIILLMDCWNPHLTPDERIAVKSLVETISDLQRVELFTVA